MKSGVFPKCGSTEIRTEERRSARDFLPGGSFFNPQALTNFAYGDYGYLESDVTRENLERLNSKWPRFAPQTAGKSV